MTSLWPFIFFSYCVSDLLYTTNSASQIYTEGTTPKQPTASKH